MATIIALLVLMALNLAGSVAWAWVFTYVWNHALVPFGAPQITWAVTYCAFLLLYGFRISLLSDHTMIENQAKPTPDMTSLYGVCLGRYVVLAFIYGAATLALWISR